MDKHKIIDEVLAEWAMRSPDGLVGGHDTPENIAVLNEILDERVNLPNIFQSNFEKKAMKLSQQERDTINPLDLKYFKVSGTFNNPTISSDETHPVFGGGIYFKSFQDEAKFIKTLFPKTELPSQKELDKFFVDGKYKLISSNKKKWDIPFLELKKGFNSASAQKIYDAINVLSTRNATEFLDTKLDNLTPEAAIQYVNAKANESDFSKFIVELDKARSTVKRKSDEVEGPSGAAGRGEYIMVLLIKDSKSGGAKSGDIILPDGKKIDVKEADNSFRVSAAAFGPGRFEKIPYVHAVNDLAIRCRDPQIAKVMLDLIEQADMQDKIETGKRGRKLQEKAGAIEFVKNPSFRTLTASKIIGLEALRQYVIDIKRGEEGKAVAADKVEFDVKNTTELLKVKKIEEPDLNKIKNPDPQGSEVKVTVEPIEKEKQEMEIILPKIKKFEFFRLDAMYDPVTVANEMFDVMSTGEGNYTGGVITHFNNKFEYEPNLSNWYGKWKFSQYAQNGPAFAKIEKSASKDIQ